MGAVEQRTPDQGHEVSRWLPRCYGDKAKLRPLLKGKINTLSAEAALQKEGHPFDDEQSMSSARDEIGLKPGSLIPEAWLTQMTSADSAILLVSLISKVAMQLAHP